MINCYRNLTLFVLLVASISTVGYEVRANLLVAESSGDLGYGYGFNQWNNFTAEIDSAFNNQVTVVSDFTDLAQMLASDALLLDQRWTNGSLLAGEANNVAAFAATGRRVLMIGENSSWDTWNNQILAIVGGSYAGQSSAQASRLVLNEITDGAPLLTLPTAGTAGTASGGTALYDPNFATLWGASENVLTVLDVNVWDDGNWNTNNGGVFGRNVAQWLAGVPEPGTVSLALVAVTMSLAAARRDR